MKRPGRNDPCPCGSGKKFKKCCAGRNEPAPDSAHTFDDYRVKAYKAMSEADWKTALALFNQIVDDAPDRYNVLRAIGACHDGAEDFLRAVEFYEKALAECPEERRFEIAYQLGVAAACADRFGKAEDAFRRCIELTDDEGLKERLAHLIKALEETEADDSAANPFYVNVQLQRAFADMEADRHEEAAARLEKLAAIEPRNSTIFFNLGVVYTFLKRENEALDLYARTVELNPEFAQAWYNMGQICLLTKRDFSRALSCFDRAVGVRPDYVGAHHQRGVVFELLGEPGKALECWERALQYDPEDKTVRESIERVKSNNPPRTTTG